MCSIISLQSSPREIGQFFPELRDPAGCDAKGFDLRAHGFLKNERAPVVFADAAGRCVIEEKYFSLCPAWSKQWPFRFETYNARLSRPKRARVVGERNSQVVLDEKGNLVEEFIYSVPSFRDAFNSGQTCLVPITAAVESCYFGLSAGHIVRFSPREGSFLFALGLYNDWVDTISGEVIPTFTLLTDAPDAFVHSHGHDRGLIVIAQEEWRGWLADRRMSGIQRFKFARGKRIQPAWRCESERQMKAGWQRRAPTAAEIADISIWSPDAAV